MGNVIGLELGGTQPTYTVQLNTAYKSPVRTPGTIMAQSWIKKVEDAGRKIWVEGIIESQDQGRRIMHAKAEGLWVVGKGKL
jgi:acyl-coenzyme A thioesterase PaaI-like protein